MVSCYFAEIERISWDGTCFTMCGVKYRLCEVALTGNVTMYGAYEENAHYLNMNADDLFCSRTCGEVLDKIREAYFTKGMTASEKADWRRKNASHIARSCETARQVLAHNREAGK